MRINLMIEGQEGVTWDDWVALAGACEEHGLEGLFRSDHYQGLISHPERPALDAWTTLAALGPLTSTIRLGTLVSPATFRPPAILCRSVVTADHTSGGRVELGMGAGWHDTEHLASGLPFPDVGTRVSMLEEQVELVHRWMTEDGFDHDGAHYRVTNGRAEPKPVQSPRVPIILGGAAGPRVSRLAARFAQEYNTVFPTLDELAERRDRLRAACVEHGRDPDSLAYSFMTGCVVGRDEAEVADRLGRVAAKQGLFPDGAALREAMADRWIMGTPDQCAEQLAAREAVGAQRAMLQHLVHDDLDMVALIGDLATA